MHARVLCTLLALSIAACSDDSGANPSADGASEKSAGASKRLAVIPKGTTHVFWKSVERGAKEAGRELGVEVIWKGPLQENDRAQQIQLVQQFLSQHVDGIALAPLDRAALVQVVREARAANIPVVIFDSSLDGTPGKDFTSYVATDNQKAGALGGDALASAMGNQGGAVVMRYMVGSASTTDREEGCLGALRAHAGVKILVDNRYSGTTTGEAKSEALNSIDQLRAAQGIFCPNESSTFGMLLALRQEGLVGKDRKVKFVGFDSSPPLVEALTTGEIDALVVQDPRKMGRLSVEQLVKALDGKEVAPVIDTGATLVTRENMESDDVKRLFETD